MGKIDLSCHPITAQYSLASDIILLFSGVDGFYFLLLALHMYVCMCRRFFENHPNEICSHSIEKPSKGRFFKPDKLQNHTNEGKGKEKKKEPGGEEKKAMVALLVFIMATLETVFGRK